MMVTDDISGDNITNEQGASQPVRNLTTLLTSPLRWTFMREPAWKWGAFFMLCSLFAIAWKGALRYMK